MYSKVFCQIFDSSIADDFRLRHFFMDLLVLADLNGVVDMTPSAISARTRIPLDDVLTMLAKLETPDPESRTPDADGRRIERLDDHRTWGWHIINYSRFRQIASEEQRREKTRDRVARFKAKRQQNAAGNAVVTPANAGNAMQRQMQKQKEINTQPPAEVMVQFPLHLNTPRIHAQWTAWMAYRRTCKKVKDWASMFQRQMVNLTKYTEEQAYEVLDQSMRNGWTGLYEPKANGIKHSSASQNRNEGTFNANYDVNAALSKVR